MKQTRLEIEVLEEVNLKTRWGSEPTLKLKQTDVNRSHKHTILWVSKNWGFIPLRIDTYIKNELDGTITVIGGQFNGKDISG